MSKTKPKLIIIDGNALIHRSFHALPPTLRTKKGVLVNAVYGFSSFLLKALNEFHPEYVVLTLDKKGPTFRHEAYAEYKATRVKAPDELYEQIPLVKEVATAFNIPIFELSGYEADDLIGTICRQTDKEKNLEKIIITGDMDTLQLVNERTKVYTMSRGLSDSVLYGPEEVKARYNLRSDQIIDYKALRGDVSDNIPGVKGIGEKTASDLLVAFENLDGVYQAARHSDKAIKPRIAALLIEHEKSAYLSRDLATIEQAVPLEFSLADISFSSFQTENVVKVFSDLEFRSLLPKVKELKDRLIKERLNASPKNKKRLLENTLTNENEDDKFLRNTQQFSYQLIDDERKFSAFFKKLKAQKSFSLDTETSGLDPLNAKLLGMSFSWKPGEAYFVLAEKSRLRKLQAILEDQRIKKSGHNLKFDWRVFKNQGINLAGLDFDTMVASYLLNPGNRQHSLDALAFAELGFEKISKQELAGEGAKQLTLDFSAFDPKRLSLYACEDADWAGRLSVLLRKRLRKEGLLELMSTIEMPLIPVLGSLEENGIKLDPKPLAQLSREVAAKLDRLEKDIYQEAGAEFNVNSPKQLQEILFSQLEIPSAGVKKTKTGISTADEELAKLEGLHPLIALIREYRELNKLQNTYLQALPNLINPRDGRLHTSFNQTITATGRLSSTEPNLQNIPTRTSEGQKIRQAFVAAPGFRLVGFDYSQIELRLAAHLSGDQKLIAAFKKNQDIHAATAAAINGIPLTEVTKEKRREAKAVNFGILYGQGPHGLSQAAGIPYFQANEFIKKYFENYPGIKKMVDGSIKEARQRGYASTLFGRKRPLPEIDSNIPAVRKAAERMAINTPLQGTAADMIKKAMIAVNQLIAGQEKEIRMLLQIHDELIFEIKETKVDFYAPKIKDIMQSVLPLKVPVLVEEARGDNWGELK